MVLSTVDSRVLKTDLTSPYSPSHVSKTFTISARYLWQPNVSQRENLKKLFPAACWGQGFSALCRWNKYNLLRLVIPREVQWWWSSVKLFIVITMAACTMNRLKPPKLVKWPAVVLWMWQLDDMRAILLTTPHCLTVRHATLYCQLYRQVWQPT